MLTRTRLYPPRHYSILSLFFSASFSLSLSHLIPLSLSLLIPLVSPSHPSFLPLPPHLPLISPSLPLSLISPPHHSILIFPSSHFPLISPSHPCNHSREDGNDSRLRSIETISVAVIADSSELASAIPSLLDGVGVPASNITILHDFDSTNQVLYTIPTFRMTEMLCETFFYQLK